MTRHAERLSCNNLKGGRWSLVWTMTGRQTTSVYDHFGLWPLRSMTISVHDHFGPRTKMVIHFGSWSLRSLTISIQYENFRTISVHDQIGPWPLRSITRSVFPLCVKRTIGPSCQVPMCMIVFKSRLLSIPPPTLTPASKVQISGGRLQLTLTNVYQVTDEV